jgi:ribonucleoside-diphosphate reductase alpha chain
LIAKSAAAYLPSEQKKWEDKFFNLLWKGWLSPSTPVMANMGTGRALSVSCSGTYVGDSMWDIAYSNYEIAMLSKYGFGTAAFFDVRAGMSEISSGGKSNSVTDWIEQAWRTQNKISQGSTRRGSTASYLDFWHQDLMEVLPMLEKYDRLHLGIICDDTVKESLAKGDKDAWTRYKTILTWRARKGKPYLIFIDNAKRQDPECYREHGWSTKQSQLCITGDQRVVTDRGYLTAKELHDQGGDLILFDNEKAVEASPMKLREKDVDVYKITLDNGMDHKVTAYHGIPVVGRDGKITRVGAKDLKLGNRVAIQTKKGIFGTKNMPKEAFLLGQYQGDGTKADDVIMIDLWENDFDLIDEIEESFAYVHHEYGCDTYTIIHSDSGKPFTREAKTATFHDCQIPNGDVKKKRLSSKTLHKALNFEKGYVPGWIWEADEKTVWQYVRGLLYADGTVRVGEGTSGAAQLSLANINRDFLKELQMLFNNLGLKSSIRLLRKAGKQLLPDGKGGQKLYDTKDCFRLIVSNRVSCLEIEKQTGFLSRKNIHIEDREYNDNTKKAFKVVALAHIGKEDVYCPTVYNDKHLFVSNGLLTFNCTEIFLSTDSDHTFSCVLSSMNGTKFDEWKDENAVFDATVFLDCINEDLIVRGSKIPGLERVVRFSQKSRALGLGLLGFHSYLQDNKIPMNSLEAKFANTKIFKHMNDESLKASQFMAEWLGEPAICKGYGLRNTHRQTREAKASMTSYEITGPSLKR